MAEQETNTQQMIVDALLKDRKLERRWRNIRFFIGAFLVLLFFGIGFIPMFFGGASKESSKPYVSLVRLNGVIMPGTNFSARRVLPQLSHAFADKQAKGVVLVINSPGGSPVQASIIHDKIIALKEKYHKKVVVYGEDTLASGAYLIASAADNIYVNGDTLTGSIGVIMNGFGFTDAISKLGISRRVFTAGANKDRLDPFKPMEPQDKVKIRKVLDQVHQSFIDDVVQGRGSKLKGDRQELFSGDFWTGEEAAKLGLVDGTTNLWNVLEQQFKVEHYRDYTRKPNFLQALLKGMDEQLNLGLFEQGMPVRAQL